MHSCTCQSRRALRVVREEPIVPVEVGTIALVQFVSIYPPIHVCLAVEIREYLTGCGLAEIGHESIPDALIGYAVMV